MSIFTRPKAKPKKERVAIAYIAFEEDPAYEAVLSQTLADNRKPLTGNCWELKGTGAQSLASLIVGETAEVVAADPRLEGSHIRLHTEGEPDFQLLTLIKAPDYDRFPSSLIEKIVITHVNTSLLSQGSQALPLPKD